MHLAPTAASPNPEYMIMTHPLNVVEAMVGVGLAPVVTAEDAEDVEQKQEAATVAPQKKVV